MASWWPGSMKSGPALKGWRRSPRSRRAARRASVTVVLPTPLPVAATRKAFMSLAAEGVARPVEGAGREARFARESCAPRRRVEHRGRPQRQIRCRNRVAPVRADDQELDPPGRLRGRLHDDLHDAEDAARVLVGPGGPRLARLPAGTAGDGRIEEIPRGAVELDAHPIGHGVRRGEERGYRHLALELQRVACRDGELADLELRLLPADRGDSRRTRVEREDLVVARIEEHLGREAEAVRPLGER